MSEYTTTPELEREEGSIFNYLAGDLVFPYQPGMPKDVGLVYDWREPTVSQLQEMLDMDGKARSLEQVVTMPLIGAGWHVEPGEGNDDHETAQWVENILRKDNADGGMSTSMENVISQMCTAFVMRRSYHEKVFKRDSDNQVVFDKIAWRPPETCVMVRNKQNGELEGFNQWVYGQPQMVSILLPYAMVYVHGQHRNPVKGMSDFEVVYRNYRTKEKLKFLWYTFCEVMSLPRTIVLANSDAAAKKSAQAIAALKNAGVAGIPKDWVTSIQPLPAAVSGGHDFQEAIAYCDSDSALSLLAGFTDLPGRAMGTGTGMAMGTRGSYGLSASQQEFFMTVLDAYAVELETCITNNVVADLVRYNKGTKVQVPRFTLGPLQEEDVTQSYSLLESMATATNLNVPPAFVQELTMLVADRLGLNTDEIGNQFDKIAQQLADAANAPPPPMPGDGTAPPAAAPPGPKNASLQPSSSFLAPPPPVPGS